MLILLPPSKTQRSGPPAGSVLELPSLRFPQLIDARSTVIEAVRELAADKTATIAALKLGGRQHGEVERNRAVLASPVAPAMERFSGVLYDALDASTLSAPQRQFAERHVVIHSAMFGLVGAGDLIPAYRLSAESRVPGLSLVAVWTQAIRAVLSGVPGLILDLRSEAYAALGPAPERDDSRYVRVVTDTPDGRARALNHFNKKAKGEFTRAVISHGVDFTSARGLSAWARRSGFGMRQASGGVLELVPRS